MRTLEKKEKEKERKMGFRLAGLILAAMAFFFFSATLASGRMASPIGPHGAYFANMSRCRDCHSLHWGVPFTLLRAPTVYSACLTCHDGSGANTNVLDGIYKPKGTPLSAGLIGSNVSKATSSHESNEMVSLPPGGDPEKAVLLDCGVCHDPHGSDNLALAQERINGSSFPGTLKGIKEADYSSTTYQANTTEWCSSCHTDYLYSAGGKYSSHRRHQVKVSYSEGAQWYEGRKRYGGITTSLPTEEGKITCLTCHYAHGTRAKRSAPKGSCLLRIDEAGVCYNCHFDAGEKEWR